MFARFLTPCTPWWRGEQLTTEGHDYPFDEFDLLRVDYARDEGPNVTAAVWTNYQDFDEFMSKKPKVLTGCMETGRVHVRRKL